LYLELLGRREDGYHEIDTVMVPIDLCDELVVRRRADDKIVLSVDWLPSRKIVAQRLGLRDDSDKAAQLLQIPESEANLVHQALRRFRDQLDPHAGFDCSLQKRIPAGAGMGGASSNAASALLCAARLSDAPAHPSQLFEIAASIGSDVPFFLGFSGDNGHTFAARARGRGERLRQVPLASTLHFVIIFPGESLSTAKVYAAAQVPRLPHAPTQLLAALESGHSGGLGKHLYNRLQQPAQKILPRIDEILDSMWRCGLQACQLTGSGSACFAVQHSAHQAQRCAARLRAMLEPGAFVSVASSVSVPAPIFIDQC
jgi:4-diphosphocytidyl-2-C-methyl-D-erythritol kinase